MTAVIDDHRAAHRVKPICKGLPIAPSTCHAHAAWRADPAKPPARLKRDNVLKADVRRMFEADFGLCGWAKRGGGPARKGIGAARCTTGCPMRQTGLGALSGTAKLRPPSATRRRKRAYRQSDPMSETEVIRRMIIRLYPFVRTFMEVKRIGLQPYAPKGDAPVLPIHFEPAWRR